MVQNNLSLGKLGEKIAVTHLIKHRYQITETNYRIYGGEIDIIAQKNNKYIFIEVKCRVGDQKGKPYEAVNRFKLFRLKRTIQYYVKLNHLSKFPLRIDIISIILNENEDVEELKHFENIGI